MAGEGITIDVRGLRELDKLLKQAGPKAAKASLRAGLRAAARIYIKEGRKRLPASYRTLAKALNVKLARPKRGGNQLEAVVGATAGRRQRYNAWYAHIIEKGAEWSEDIVPQRARVLVESFRSRGGGTSYGRIIGTRARPGPLPPRPFLGPAFKGRSQEAIRAAGAKIWATLEKRLRR